MKNIHDIICGEFEICCNENEFCVSWPIVLQKDSKYEVAKQNLLNVIALCVDCEN